MKRNLKSNRDGFTLVELLAVIVILALLIVITANTVIPMMNKTEKTGMVTYASKVMSNAMASYQADILTSGTGEKYYEVTKLMEQDDYYGCVMISDSTYKLKLFSASDDYAVMASNVSTDAWAKGKIDSNGTISDINVDTEVVIDKLVIGSLDSTNLLTTDSRVKDIEAACQSDFSNINVNHKS